MPTIADTLTQRVRELLARSHRIVRRSAILIVSSQHARSRDSLIAHCAWCEKVRVGGVWVAPEELPRFVADLPGERRTHGICPTCLEEVQRRSQAAPIPPTAVVIRAPGPLAVESLSRALHGYALHERPNFALEATLPNTGSAALKTLLSKVSSCLEENELGPVTIELSDRTYVLG
jgi:hypothetical protein